MTTKFTPTTAMISAAENLVMAMAHLQLIKPVVDAYKTAILLEGQWKIRPEYADRLGDEVIKSPDRAYLMADEDFAKYDALCKQARDTSALKVTAPDNCPLLEAEHALSVAQNALIDVMSEVTKVESKQILILGLEKRAKFVDLTLRLLAPFLNPKQLLGASV